jgi:hypothetical protein
MVNVCYDAIAQPIFTPVDWPRILNRVNLAPVAHGSRGLFCSRAAARDEARELLAPVYG